MQTCVHQAWAVETEAGYAESDSGNSAPFAWAVSFERLFARCRSAKKVPLTGNSAANWSTNIMTDHKKNPYQLQLSSEVAEGTDAVALNPPTTLYPPQDSQHAPGYVMLAGDCLQGAKVHILNPDNTIWAEAIVEGTKWRYLHKWVVGQWSVRTGQIVNGVPSYPSVERRFTVSVKSDAPLIAAPVDDSRYRQGPVPIVVGCDPAASAVQIQNYDGSFLGEATKLMPGLWRFTRSWDRGLKGVKAVAFVNGMSSPSGMIMFHVE
jgi:hypothetical protein